MSIFQVVCIVALAIEIAIFGIHIFLDTQNSDEADIIFYIFGVIAAAIGLMSLLSGAIGLITLGI